MSSGVAARFVGVVLTLVTVPMLLSSIGKERFGLWMAITSTLAWLSLFDLSLPASLVNAISQAHGRNERQSAAAYVSSAFAVLACMSLILLTILLASAPLIRWSLAFPSGDDLPEHVLRLTMILAVCASLASMPLAVVRAVYTGYQRSYVPDLFATAGSLLTLPVLALVIRLGAEFPSLVLAFYLPPLVVALANLIYLVQVEMPWLGLSVARISRAALRRLSATAFPLMTITLGGLMVNQSQFIILAHISPLGTVADYSVIVRLIQIFSSLILVITAAFIPTFREASERGDYSWIPRAFAQMLRLRMAWACAFVAAMVLGGNQFVGFWLRRGDVVFPLTVWLAFGAYLLAATWVTAHSDLLVIMDRVWLLAGLAMINGFATVALTFWLAPGLGVFGVIVASAVISVVGWTWLLPILARTHLRPKKA